jgi:hypothetical protein
MMCWSVLFYAEAGTGSMSHAGSRGTVKVNQADEPAHAVNDRFSRVSNLGIFRGYPRHATLDKISSCASAGEMPAWIVRLRFARAACR